MMNLKAYTTTLFLFFVTLLGHSQEKLNVLSSASMFADMASNIGGDKITVRSIVPIGADPHLYDPSPSDVGRVLDADVILVNGLTFEGWIKKLIKNSGTKALVKTITEGITPIASEDYDNASDPHAWMNAENGLTYVDNILEVLIKASPENEAYFRANHTKYRVEVKAVHEYMKKAILAIPEKQRVLITSHDAFAYYGKAYGLTLNAIKGISTEEETQTSDIIRVSKVIKETGVKAIFIESTINPKMIQQIAADNNVTVGGELYADSLGPKGSEGESYIKMLKHNTDVIVNALSKSISSVTKIDTEGKGTSLWVYLALGFAMLLALGFLVSKFK